jgi:hypothetical protein
MSFDDLKDEATPIFNQLVEEFARQRNDSQDSESQNNEEEDDDATDGSAAVDDA